MRQLEISLLLFFLVQSYAAAVQKPLAGDGAFREDLFRSTPKGSLNNQLLRPLRPMASACYSVDGHSPFPGNETKCKILMDKKENDVFATDDPAGYYFGNWIGCQSTGETCTIPVKKDTYGSYISPASKCHQGNIPEHYVDVRDEHDVFAAFDEAEKLGKRVVIKNTGHDWKGRSAGRDAIAIWTHNIRQNGSEPARKPIKVETAFTPDGCPPTWGSETALTFGAGEQWRGIYEAAEKNDLTVVGGTCGTVGVAGWIHGGGHSPLTPSLGMGVDHMLQFKVALPSTKKLVVVNACQNRDLFRAIKGGGGGTFGVIMEMTYRAMKRRPIQEYAISLPGLDAKGIHRLFDVLTQNAVEWSKQGWGGYINTGRQSRTVTLVKPDNNQSAAAEDMADLVRLGRDMDLNSTLKMHESWYTYYQSYFADSSYHVGAWGTAVSSRLIPPAVFENETSRALLVEKLIDLHYSNVNFILMPVTPTKFKSTEDSSLHPSWRNATWLVRISERWDPFYEAATPRSSHERFEKISKAIEPIRELTPGMGVSISEADLWEANHEEAFWGAENYETLKKVKDAVDPKRLLRVWQGVGWDKKDAGFACYPQEIL